MDERRFREGLERLAAGADEPIVSADRVVRRSLRRMVRNGLVAVVSIGVLSSAAIVVGARLLERGNLPAVDPAATGTGPIASQAEGLIAFISDRAGGTAGHVFTMHADGSNLRQVTMTPAYSSGLSWSPDGKELVVDRGLAEGRGALVVVSVQSGDETVLTDDEDVDEPLNPQGPQWSPDGSTIAFSSGGGDIYLIDRDGSSLRKVRGSARSCGHRNPEWSPDGRHLVFASNCPRGGLFVIPGEGGEPERLTDDSRDQQPAWSPDGTRIAFERGGADGRAIYVLEVGSGRTPTRLTDETDSYDPSWSPDGSAIVFGSNRGGTQNIWMMGSDGSGEKVLTEDGMVDLAPAWSPS